MSTLAILGGEPIRRRPFSPWPQYQAGDLDRIVRTVESRHWGGYPYPTLMATEFCRGFAELQGAKYALPVANGTVSITVSLQALGVTFGDEVIVPAYTWDGTATAVLAMGAIPVFADIDPDTYCLDVESVRAAITPRTRAIVPVHLAMRFTEMDRLLGLAAEYNLKIVEDCAHAHGGAYKGRGAGAMGDIGSFSLQESKLRTAGEGGLLTPTAWSTTGPATVITAARQPHGPYGQRLGLNYRNDRSASRVLIGQMESCRLCARNAPGAPPY